ncbi:hypothetical protein [Dokdonella sp.]|uniref:hypothetical protein n=1 Tax=Dokdonella sp. TaxID=2291710 RepID=UPI00352787FB
MIACGLALVGNSEALALISGGAICLLYLGVCSATWFAQKRVSRSGGIPMLLPGGALIPALGSLAMIAILFTLSSAEWVSIIIALLSLVVLYVLACRLRQQRFRHQGGASGIDE